MDEEKKEQGAESRPMARKLKRELPNHVFAVAAQNLKNRFYIPSKSNSFAGVSYDYVMIDSGCNSFLLPFKHEVLDLFAGPSYQWKIWSSKGSTGGGIHARTLLLKITRGGGTHAVGTMTLAGNENLMALPFLRFHLGSASVRSLLQNNNNNKLNPTDTQKLRDFLSAMGDTEAPERRHGLLGQIYLKTVLSLQLDGLLLMCDSTERFPTRADLEIVERILLPLRGDFPEFDDLEDDDHDGDEADCYEFEIDEIDDPIDDTESESD